MFTNALSRFAVALLAFLALTTGGRQFLFLSCFHPMKKSAWRLLSLLFLLLLCHIQRRTRSGSVYWKINLSRRNQRNHWKDWIRLSHITTAVITWTNRTANGRDSSSTNRSSVIHSDYPNSHMGYCFDRPSSRQPYETYIYCVISPGWKHMRVPIRTDIQGTLWTAMLAW